MDIYNDLKDGYILDGKGDIKKYVTLSFQFIIEREKEKCEFMVENLKVTDKEIRFKSVSMYKGNETYKDEEKIPTVKNGVETAKELFITTLNSYLRDDKEFNAFKGWEVFNIIKELSFEGEQLPTILDDGKVDIYTLKFDNDELKIYRNEKDTTLILDENNNILPTNKFDYEKILDNLKNDKRNEDIEIN